MFRKGKKLEEKQDDCQLLCFSGNCPITSHLRGFPWQRMLPVKPELHRVYNCLSVKARKMISEGNHWWSVCSPHCRLGTFRGYPWCGAAWDSWLQRLDITASTKTARYRPPLRRDSLPPRQLLRSSPDTASHLAPWLSLH